MRYIIIFFVFVSIVVNGCSGNKNAQEQQVHEHDHENATTDCQHCGMPSLEFPKWYARMNDAYFCSPRCMFMHINQARVSDEEKASVTVVDYYSLNRIKASEAWFVAGSDIIGPMGHDLVPLASEAEAKEFMEDHQGKEVLRFGQVTLETIKALGK